MSVFLHLVLPFCAAFAVVAWVFPKILTIALAKQIVDCPDERKVQRRPVPVLGGAAIFIGVTVGMMLMVLTTGSKELLPLYLVLAAMLYMGMMDDILGLSPRLRLVVEVLMALFLVVAGLGSLNDFHGLFGLDAIPRWAAFPLTLVAVVGIINALNLLDGIDGLSSGYSVMACLLFAVLFYRTEHTTMAMIAAATAGALVPFFCHNVFGYASKMFIGDGGTLLLGALLAAFVLQAIDRQSPCAVSEGVGECMVPFVVAVLAIPVFDTLRVLTTRLCRGVSPFHPDKSHLHHILLELGCSHLGGTVIIVGLNLLIVAAWWSLMLLGYSVHVQLSVVVSLSLLFTFGLYAFLAYHIVHQTRIYRVLHRWSAHSHCEHHAVFRRIRQTIDQL